MDNIIIDKMRDVIVIEKHNNNTILKGSQMFCGCCGESLGFVTEDITFPFDSSQLISVLADRSFVVTLLGLKHETCGHTMFSFRGWGFISVENYYLEVAKES